MKVAIYSRKSVLSASGDSVENQIELCRKYISEKLHGEIEVLIFEDDGYSAKDTKRPEFIKMIELAKERKIDCIVCYRLDRLSRNVADFSSLVTLLDRYGISLICIKEQFDTSTPMGRAMMYIASVFSQLERETIAERVKDNMYLLARDGRWLGGNLPYGFTCVQASVKDSKGKTKKLLFLSPNSYIDNVKVIFNIFLSCKNLSITAEKLKNKGIKYDDKKFFTRNSLRSILSNPVYCRCDETAKKYFMQKGAQVFFEADDFHGLIAYNRRNSHGFNDLSEWIVAKGEHEGIISSNKWIKVQNIIASSAKKSKRICQTALLSGKIFCSLCSNKMFAKKRNAGDFDYICSSKLNAKGCACCNLNGKETDRKVLQALISKLAQDDEMWSKLDDSFFDKISCECMKALICQTVDRVEWNGKDTVVVHCL